MKNNRKLLFTFAGAVLFLGSALHAEEKCPVEVKLLLSPQAIQTVIESLGFENKTAGRVYFFDTDELNLLRQGVIVRVRQGADNDLTVKVRAPEGNKQIDTSKLREHFPCEIDRTGAGENVSFSVRSKYKALQVPEMGNDISSRFSPQQKMLLQEARVSINWSQVTRIANIQSTKWETTTQSPFRKLALELWESRAGNILEVSTKVGPDAGPSKYEELRGLMNMKRLSLSARQGTKTSIVLEALTDHTPTSYCCFLSSEAPDGVLASFSSFLSEHSTQDDDEHKRVRCRSQYKSPEASSASLRQFNYQSVHDYSSGDK